MTLQRSLRWLIGLTALWGGGFSPACAEGPASLDVLASPPQNLSVTLYRNPDRRSGSLRLSALGGFALVTETRQVSLPAGESRVRFEGVVDGVQAETAIITGLPEGVVEKNRDARLLSPETLITASLGAEVTLVRLHPKTGTLLRTSARIRSADRDGVVVQTDDGVEALKCSGLAETLQFSRPPDGLSSKPTLSVLTRSSRAVTARVTLSYLASGFDWAADYVARTGPDGKTMDLTGWITLANNNSVALPSAEVQVVAGRLNRTREASEAPPVGRVLAHCWPHGATSDAASDEVVVTALPRHKASTPMAAALRQMAIPTPPPPPSPEALGDLKLYRLAQPTTIAARQSKQVRLLQQTGVGFRSVVVVEMPIQGTMADQPAFFLLRSRNALSQNLGLPLPSGQVAVFRPSDSGELLVGSAPLSDTAVDEILELKLGRDPSITASQSAVPGSAKEVVTISNGADHPVKVELRLRPYGRLRVVDADRPMTLKDGRPMFYIDLPANGSVTIHYDVKPV